MPCRESVRAGRMGAWRSGFFATAVMGCALLWTRPAAGQDVKGAAAEQDAKGATSAAGQDVKGAAAGLDATGAASSVGQGTNGAAPAADEVNLRKHADPDRKAPRLVYKQGPKECVAEEIFRDEVAITLDGGDHFDATAPDVVRVWFEKMAGKYRGTIEYADENGKKEPPRVLTGRNCETLARWVGGAASDYIPEHLWRHDPPPCPVCPVCVACKEPWVPPSSPPQNFERPSSKRRKDTKDMDVTIALSGLGLITAGLTADVGPGFGLMVDVRGEVLSLGLEIRGVLPARTIASNAYPGKAKNYDGEFDMSQWTALLVPCARWKYLVGCAVFQGGVLFWKNDFDMAAMPVISLGPRVGFEVPFADRFALFGFGEALFAVIQNGIDFIALPPGTPSAGFKPSNTEWTQSIVSGYFGLGLSVKFQ